MTKLIVFSGLSGAGKTTTIQQEFTDRTTYIVSYDELRERWPGAQPHEIMFKLIKAAAFHLMMCRDVVVDACNLHPHDKVRWETLAMVFGAELVWRFIDTPAKECIARDALRANPVGADFIRKQNFEFYLAQV